jgi:alanyl-tRNA synthetase
MALQDAKNAGAIAMFGEKYGEEVGISWNKINTQEIRIFH